MNEFAYVAIHKCGAIVAAEVDLEDARRGTAREVARWIRRGETIERRPIEEVRKAEWCQCYRKKVEA